MRIIGGQWGGRILPARVPAETRPTQDAVREAIFNMLTARYDIEGMHVLDLYAGTGAFGIEALSRGAEFCAFVDKSPRAARAIADNCQLLQVEQERFRIACCDAIAFVEAAEGAFELVFADPPYRAEREVSAIVSVFAGAQCIAESAVLIVEHAPNVLLPVPPTVTIVAQRRWGDTACSILQRQ